MYAIPILNEIQTYLKKEKENVLPKSSIAIFCIEAKQLLSKLYTCILFPNQ
jgi:hypothetical protein